MDYDVIVIGAGPGGYVAAIEAAKNGLKTAIVEKGAIGGTCLNRGCIPSKTYLHYGQVIKESKNANLLGIETTIGKIDFVKLVEHKNQVVETLQGGINSLFKRYHIDVYSGKARISEKTEVVIGNKKITGKDIILATGGHPFVPPISGLKEIDYLTTDTFFEMKQVPKKIAIIGGGVIAVELAFALSDLGSSVTLMEVAPDILLTEDEKARAIIKQTLLDSGVEIHVAADIQHVAKNSVKLSTTTVEYDQLLVATGRRADLEIGKSLGLMLSENGNFLKVNRYHQTSHPHIYAIGDITEGYQLAHAASAEGKNLIQHLLGNSVSPIDQKLVPRCVYTSPEIASFGLSEQEAKEQGYSVKVVESSFRANGKAIAVDADKGFVKIITETDYQEILGGVIVGTNATELIHIMIGTKVAEGTVEQLKEIIYAHPTLSESIGEASELLSY